MRLLDPVQQLGNSEYILTYINWASIRNLIFEKDFRQETLVAIFQWMMMSIFGSMKIELRNHESISKCFVLGK